MAFTSSADAMERLGWEGDPQLMNPDLVPTPVEDRKWTWWSYSALWMGMVHNIFAFTWIGGLMSAMGMSALQALSVAFVGCFIQTLLIGLNGRVGARHGIPFAVWSRSAFGVYGANIPALARGFVAIGWFGVQSYLGATAVNVLFELTIPAWHGLGQTTIIGAPANLMICMIIFWAVNIFVVKHGMDTVRRFESWAGPMVFVVLAVLMIWAIRHAGGIGPIFSMPSKFESTTQFLLTAFVPCVCIYISGSWATMVLNIPDLTRFARSNKEQFLGTMIGMPLAVSVFYIMSSIIVSACFVIFGKLMWNPSDILMAVGNPVMSFIGALLLAIATISVNIPANLVSPAYDLTNLLPKIFNFKSAALFGIVVSFVIMPWKLMENPAVLYGILNNIGAMLGPATGIMIADFFIVRKQLLDVPELFKVNGRYQYKKGFSPIAVGILLVVSGILISGQFISSLAWVYEYAWFVGLPVAFVLYLACVAILKQREGELPEYYQPIGDFGIELAEIEKN